MSPMRGRAPPRGALVALLTVGSKLTASASVGGGEGGGGRAVGGRDELIWAERDHGGGIGSRGGGELGVHDEEVRAVGQPAALREGLHRQLVAELAGDALKLLEPRGGGGEDVG